MKTNRVVLFAVLATMVFAAKASAGPGVGTVVASADPMSECIDSGGDWNQKGKEGRKCECTGDYIHVSVVGGVCADKCMKRPAKVVVPPPPAAEPAHNETAPPPAKVAAPVADTFCRGWIKRTDAINRVQNWNDDLACSCATACKSLGKIGKNPLAKFNPNSEDGIFCESLDPDHYDSGVCGLVPKSGSPGLPGMAGQQGEEGEAGLACWDLNEDGRFEADTEDMDGDGKATVADCRGPKGAPGVAGRDGKNGTNAVYTCSNRCADTGGTYLATSSSCACKPGYHASGCGCVMDPPKNLFERFHLIGTVYAAGSFSIVGKPVKVPFGAGPGLGLAIDLTKWLQIDAIGGLFFAGDNDHPVGSFVSGGFRIWPSRYFGFDLGAHGHFVGTNSELKNKFVDVGGQAGFVIQIPIKDKVRLQIVADLLLGQALPNGAMTAGYVTQFAVSWP